MIKFAITTGVVLAAATAAIVGISSYLAIDDLKDCGATPDLLVPKCAPADVIVAISGGDTSARTADAIKLYKAGWAPKLLFSGAAADTTGPSNAAAMRQQALAAGVPTTALVLDESAQDTAQNAQHAVNLLGADDTRVILVTSPYHQRRASLEFSKVFGSKVTLINHPTTTDKSWGPYWWTTANGWWLGLSEATMSWAISSWR